MISIDEVTILDGYMSDLLMNLLEEKEISNDLWKALRPEFVSLSKGRPGEGE